MLSQSQIETYKKNGFVRGNRVLDDDQVDELRSELDRIIALDDESAAPRPVRLANLSRDENSVIWQIVDIWMASEPFKALLSNSEVVDSAAALSDAKELRVWHDQIQYKIASKGGVNMWHQDSPYWPNIGPKDAQITAWIALDDVDENNGCMSMVPGSHLWGNQIDFIHTIKSFDAMPESFDNNPLEVVLCPVSKGHVHFHHSLTWHGSHANTSGLPRRAIAVHFMTERTVYDASGSHIMKPYISVTDGAKLSGESFPLVWPAA